jgi:hypothetical protein
MLTIRRPLLFCGLVLCFAAWSFSLGAWYTQQRIEQQVAANDARIEQLHDQMARSVLQARQARMPRPTGTGLVGEVTATATDSQSHGTLVEEIKRQLQSEMGLLSPRVLRERRTSFVEVNAHDASGNLRYGTAGHLGNGYFITVKHGVMALKKSDDDRRILSVKITYEGKQIPATVVDSGNAEVEVHAGDWAIIKVKREIDLPALRVDTDYPFEFAEPIFRLGNDYSKGVILSSGYVGRKMDNGLVTSLTDGHPGVSGGGVLDQKGNLVGIPVGRMDGDYRFSFILPLRAEMFRKVPVS